MHIIRRFLLRLGALFRSSQADAELSRELDAHLRLLEDDFLSRGLGPEAARRAARVAFGGQVQQVKERHRDTRAFRWLDESWLDLKLGARMLMKHPGLTLVGGLGMAVAIAISTAFFAFFYTYLSSTLPLEQGERIVALENWNVEANNEFRQALNDYEVWREQMTTMEEIGAFRTVARNLIIPGGAVETIRPAEITASAFRIARVAPMFGRPLLDDDQRPGAPAVIVIGHDVWQSRFSSDPGVVGREVRVGGTPHTIVGVMPEGFAFPVNHSYWLPMRTQAANFRWGQGPAIFIFGRLRDGASMEDAQAQLAAIGTQHAAAHPETHKKLSPRVLPYARPILDIQDISLVQVAGMQATVSVLLVVVAVNIAVLIYARTATREGEIAIRTALGASRGRIVSQLFVEAMLLAAGSAVVGLGLAKFGLTQAHTIIQLDTARPPYWIDYGLPFAAVAYAIGLALLAGIVAGVVPALKATGRRVQPSLRLLGGSSGMRLGATWTLLIVAQVGLAVAGLPIAVQLAWSEIRFATTTPVFAADQYIGGMIGLDVDRALEMDASTYRREAGARLDRVRHDLVERLEAEPWVSDVTLALRPPAGESSARIEIAGNGSDAVKAGDVRVNEVDADYFAAFDARMVVGRAFTSADRPAARGGARPPGQWVIVSQAFAERLLGTRDAVGRRIRYASSEAAGASAWYEIVGVVADLQTNPFDSKLLTPTLYHPLAVTGSVAGGVVIRTSGTAASGNTTRLRELMAAIDPTARLSTFSLVEVYRQGNVALRLVAVATVLVTVSVLLLSAAGIYALMSFTVSQRRREIGIRAALGADPRRLLRSVLSRAAIQLAAGTAIGIASAVAIQMASGEMGRETTVVLTVIGLLSLATGLAASVGPARRALRIQPTEALRQE